MLLILLGLLIIALYFYGTRNYDYWKKKGVLFEEPTIFVGSNLKPILDKMSVSERFAALHRLYPNEKCVGFYEANTAGLLIRDPEMIKHVLVTDFKKFHRRGLLPNRDIVEPLLRNIFMADGDIWKLMRQKLTPIFSSGKLKAMFPLIIEMADKLSKIADGLAEFNQEVDVRDLMARYTTDFIGACGFGIESDALNDESSDFRKLGKRIITQTFRDTMISLLKRTAPRLFKNLEFLDADIERKTVSIIKQIMMQRNYKPSGRNDFIDMLLELKAKGKIRGESVDHQNEDGSPKIVELEFDDLLLAAQVFIFFIAGFETSSHASSMLLHELAYHPEEQRLCQLEIDEVLNRYDGKLSFDAVREMKYLEMAFKEGLRKYPSPAFILRRSVAKSTFPTINLTVDANTLIIISTEALHRDERFFDEPEQFRPERFHPDNVGKIEKNVYMPFGDGPRTCIGERMGVMQSLAGVATILRKFTVAPSVNSIRKPLIEPSSVVVQVVKGGLPLSLKYR